MLLQGCVTNVANFGAFVDIGVHQDGLVHISELTGRFVKDTRDVVKVGQVVNVRVVKVDTELKRIALTMKLEERKPIDQAEKKAQYGGDLKPSQRARHADARPSGQRPSTAQSTPRPHQAPAPQSARSEPRRPLPPIRQPAPRPQPRIPPKPPATLDDLKKQWMGAATTGAGPAKKLKTVKPKFSVRQLLG